MSFTLEEREHRPEEILQLVLDGKISGRISEWPQLKLAIEAVLAKLKHVQSVERASPAKDGGGQDVPCEDCGQYMKADLVVPRVHWLLIHPENDGAGMLCGRCMLNRVAKIGEAVNITGRITFASEYDDADTPYQQLTNIVGYGRDVLLRVVTGALKSCIDAHGSITKDNGLISSASKRVVQQLKGYAKQAGPEATASNTATPNRTSPAKDANPANLSRESRRILNDEPLAASPAKDGGEQRECGDAVRQGDCITRDKFCEFWQENSTDILNVSGANAVFDFIRLQSK